MIRIEHVSKSFDDIAALHDVCAEIPENSIFGLAGTNGSGKSTLLRVMAGVLKPDGGQVIVDEKEVWENPEAKVKSCFLADTSWFLPNASANVMRDYYAVMYPGFDKKRFDRLMQSFGLNPKRRLSTFSKGMKKQVSVLLGICANTEYLLCDETFDGLDPVMRQAVKSLFAAEIMNRKFTLVLASHSLREIEDICDHIGLLHEGGILFAQDLDEMKLGIHKVQCVISDPESRDRFLSALDVLRQKDTGALMSLVVRGALEDVEEALAEAQPIYSEILPLTLEEIFISETEVVGYDIKNIIF